MMGKKIRKQKNDSVFAKPNKSGYQININHPKILPLYEAYKRRVGEIILSDKQRFHFEAMIFRMLENNSGKDENYVQSGHFNGETDEGS